MRVKELIEELQKLNPELPVYTNDVDYGPDEVEQVQLRSPDRPEILYGIKEEYVMIH